MSDLTGQYLGQYQILSRIARGAVATIYKAYQANLDRYVAVKVLSPHLLDEAGFLDRFTQEARAIAQLDHPNIVPVYDFNRLGDTVYLVMKYVEGGTLKQRLTGQPLDLDLTVELISQVGLALGYAHKRGVIHRDVKPSNILIAEGHWALLTDFGLAKMIAGDRKLTQSGIGLGTPDYIAPEQAEGFEVDHRADLYSLGVTMYEMVCGRVPFESERSMAVVVKHLTEPPRPPREHNPALPAALEQVILKALEKKPDDRYPNAEDFVSALLSAAPQPAGRPALPGAGVAARGISGAGVAGRDRPGGVRDFHPAFRPPEAAPASTPLLRPAWRAADRVKRWLIWLSHRRLRLAALGAAAAALVIGIWLLAGQVAGREIARINTPVAVQPAIQTLTPSGAAGLTTPTLQPAIGFTATPTPTATVRWRRLSSDAKIVPGIQVQVVKPDGVNLHTAAGFDKSFIRTIAQGSILVVLSGPVRADNLSWIKMRDVRTGTVGWGVQDYVVAYAAPR